MEHNIFDSVKIGLASPETIRSWSYGEVTKAETINYRTLKAEKDGLFCERIFGPTKDWECLCGKYKRVRYKGKVCEKCGVEVTQKKVRRERMGHVELACPVSHIWYFRAIPSKMALILDITPKALEKVLYYVNYIVLDPKDTDLEKKQVLSSPEYAEKRKRYGDRFVTGIGADAIKTLLEEINLDEESQKIKEELKNATSQRKAKLIKRLDVVESFRRSGNRPEWMILTVIPVLPPEIRPMVQLDGGRFAASDLNDLYRRVINRNNTLKSLMEINAPDIIIYNEKRMLQEAVDALIDNGRRGKPITGPSNRPLKSLSEMLRGKQGRFRQNLLGKRVDYSGRSVIVVGPELKIYQCGLPKEMALELFKPFIVKRLVEMQKATNVKDAKKKIDRVDACVWDALENVIKEHPVLLNRAPTLHRLSIQAFEPVLVEGRAIKLHPLVCTAFNADFDGDQMPVHVPLSAEAQAEARLLMLSANNLLKPVDGKAVTVPSQDMVLGSYYLTIDKAGEIGDRSEFPNIELDLTGAEENDTNPHVYRDFDEAIMAYSNGDLGIHAPIKVRVTKVYHGNAKDKLTGEPLDGTVQTRRIEATLGRLIFNQNIPQDIGFNNKGRDQSGKVIGVIDRDDPDHIFDLEVNSTCGKKELKQIVDLCIRKEGFTKAAEVLDDIKSMGYKYSTKAAISISIADVSIPERKKQIIAEAEKQVENMKEAFEEGELTEDERYSNVIAIWQQATKDIVDALSENFDRYNPIKMMADSGARGNMTQMRQLAGMRGLMFATNGRTMEIPIKSNFREGLNILDYFVAARGARKSLSDTALKTADSGYLTRRLVDVSQDVIVREDDCGATDGLVVSAITDGKDTIEPLEDRLVGRFAIGDVINPETGEVIVEDNTMISEEQAKKIVKSDIKEVKIRSLLNCKLRHGVCAHCYGADLSNGRKVQIGEAVGIIAAQSIGEPGTQLTMRTFHTGGVAGSDITQGLPRVEELFEARRPKKSAIVSEIAGTVSFGELKKMRAITITAPEDAGGTTVTYAVPFGLRIVVNEGDFVAKGQGLTEGYKAPADILHVNGLDAVYDYVIREVQKVYRMQSIDINDKHIEVIARQMTRRVLVSDPGSTDIIQGTTVDRGEFDKYVNEIQARIDAGERNLSLPVGDPILLGITKASIQTNSFLSAASFQETTRVLTDAATKGKEDHLIGLKENVIIGKLIPAGTGMEKYRSIEVKNLVEPERKPLVFEKPADWSLPDDEDDEDYDDETYEENLSDDEIDSNIDSLIDALNN